MFSDTELDELCFIKPEPMLRREELPLTSEDIKKLRKNIVPVLIFLLVFGVIIYFIFTNVMGGNNNLGGDSIITFAFGAFGMIFLAAIGYMLWAVMADIRRGIKERIEGTVTDKRLDIQTSGGHGTGSNRSKTRTSRYHYVYLEGEEFKMDYRYYGKVKVGDHIVMERAPKSATILMLEVLESATEEQRTEEVKVDHKFLSTDMIEERFSPEDYAALKRIFVKDRRRKLTFMLPIVLFASWFIASGYWGLLVFFFPVPLIFMSQSVRLFKLFLRYSKDKAHGHRKGFTTVLEDKLTVTGNRQQSKNTIHTTRGRYVVTTEIYDSLSTGDKLVIYMPSHGKKPLSIATLEGEEWYLV